jgi:hypothetical protein
VIIIGTGAGGGTLAHRLSIANSLCSNLGDHDFRTYGARV